MIGLAQNLDRIDSGRAIRVVPEVGQNTCGVTRCRNVNTTMNNFYLVSTAILARYFAPTEKEDASRQMRVATSVFRYDG